MPDPLRCAVLGAGTMGTAYAAAFAQIPGVVLSAVADIDRPRAAAVAGQYDDAVTLTGADELIAAKAADVVAVALPDFDHRESVVALLDAGLHVLCEKPLATTREDCQAIVEAASRAPGSLMVNYGNRHRPAARILRERILAGELGELQAIAFRGHMRWTHTMSLRWRGRTDPTWFLVSHIVDAVTWLTGQRITSVYGRGASGLPPEVDGVTGPSTVTYLCELEEGAHATLTSSWILPSGFPRSGDFAIEVIGTKGAAKVDFNEAGIHFWDTAASEPVWDFDEQDYDGRRPGWWFTSCRYFVDCVRQGVQPQPSALEGLRVSAVLAAMSASIERRQAEEVPDWEGALA